MIFSRTHFIEIAKKLALKHRFFSIILTIFVINHYFVFEIIKYRKNEKKNTTHDLLQLEGILLEKRSY
jgi:uncharacterized membrane protein